MIFTRMKKTFCDSYMRGEVTIDDIERYLEKWHGGQGTMKIEGYRGQTADQYFK